MTYPQQSRASLLITDQKMFEERFAQYPPQISEYTFTNLYSWKDYYRFEWQEIDGCIVLYCQQHGKQCAYVPIGPQERAVEVMGKISRDEKIPFVRIPEETAQKAAGASGLEAVFDQPVYDADNSDYLYRASDLINLAGRKYDGKRNLIRKFSSEYTFEYQALDEACIKECLKFQDSWCMEVDCGEQPGLKAEDAAVRVMLENFRGFRLAGGALRVDSTVVALAVGERLNPQTLVMHVLKARRGVHGLYQTMFHEFLKREAGSFHLVNMEQDLGVAGLRKSKLSYQPAAMVRKYTLSLRKE